MTSSTATATATATTSTTYSPMLMMKKKYCCYNPDCKDAGKPEKQQHFRKGWLLRNGLFAPLCFPCVAAFEEGKFCDTFHLDAAGWRNCESCGKRIHCGCIVSIHAYILLDAGGVDCMACATKNILMAPKQIWCSSSSSSLPLPDRLKDVSVKNWNQNSGPSAISGNWKQPANMWSTSAALSDLNPRTQYGFDSVKQISGECFVPFLQNKRLDDPSDRVNNFNLAVMDSLTNMNAPVNMVTGSHSLHRNEMSLNGLQGMTYEARPAKGVNISLPPSSSKEYPPNYHFSAAPYLVPNEENGRNSSPPVAQFNSSFQNGMDSSAESQKRIGRGRSQLLPPHCPKITDHVSKQISGDSNSVITPLFEKTLSASDAGRIGRLVLPKKYAEAYFPTITHSEGLPIKVQDAKGKEWVLHFRFWPNNNSRMYVLEGITPCIQSMQLQAGDTVTFSRVDPEGKLVMGFRKASSVTPSDQDKQSLKAGSIGSKNSEVNDADPAGSWPKNDKAEYKAKDLTALKSFIPPTKRKSRGLGAKSKRLRIDHEDTIELRLTWEEAQGLLRPPPDHDPNVVDVKGHPFEEYEEAPVLGKPTIFTTDQVGEKIQWVQCEDCFKWRKIPLTAVLPLRWTCSANLWNPKRSSCWSAQEVTSKQLEDIVSSNKTASALKKTEHARKDMNAIDASEELSTLVNSACVGEDAALLSSAQTSRHPRHRAGCTCIVCIQPPSGKGSKHKDTCICNVCLIMKRRKLSFIKHLSEKDTESSRKKLEQLQLPDNQQLEDDLPMIVGTDPQQKSMVSENSHEDPDEKKPFSPIVDRIDLNIQAEREDASSLSYSSRMVRLLSGNHKLHPILHGTTSLSHDGNFVLNESESSAGGSDANDTMTEFDSGVQHDTSLGAGNTAVIPLCLSKPANGAMGDLDSGVQHDAFPGAVNTTLTPLCQSKSANGSMGEFGSI